MYYTHMLSKLPTKDKPGSPAPTPAPSFPADARSQICISSGSETLPGPARGLSLSGAPTAVRALLGDTGCSTHGNLRHPEARGPRATAPSQSSAALRHLRIRRQGPAVKNHSHHCRPSLPSTRKKLVSGDLSSYTGAPNLKFDDTNFLFLQLTRGHPKTHAPWVSG